MTCTDEQRDRIAGVLLGAACGDALGVPYEFQEVMSADRRPAMVGGGLGPYEPGEYSDDTQMAVCIARVSATGAELRAEPALDAIAGNFLHWFRAGASDVGLQTRRLLTLAESETAPAEPDAGTGADARADAPAGNGHDPRAAGGSSRRLRTIIARLHAETGRTAGNGSLMRTAVVALRYLDDAAAMAEAARAISGLTHHDPLAGDACVLWCSGVRRAVLDATFDGVREGLALLPADRRGRWDAWLADAETRPPGTFIPNGFVVQALQAAWSAIVHTPGEAAENLVEALVAAVRVGDDTDTVAAIAGALLGARWGESAVPAEWRAAVHGWPGFTADDLVDLAVRTATPR